MERKLEKVINLFANAIFGDFLNHYVVEFLSFYVMETKIGKVETLFLMYFCGVICITLLPDIDLKHGCVHGMFSSYYPLCGAAPFTKPF